MSRQLKVYTVIEKPGRARGVWLEIGTASENRDGSISAKLDAVPMSGAIQIRDEEEISPTERLAREYLRELHNVMANSEWDADFIQGIFDELEAWK